MRKRLTESSLLFISVFKWFVLATLTGAVVGGATSFFLRLLKTGIGLSSSAPYFVLLPLGFLISSLITGLVSEEAEGHGTEKVIEAVHKNNGKIPIAVVPARLAAALVAISCGIYAGFYALSGPPAAGAINSQISENIISGGIFGSETAPYATVACLISFLRAGHRSVCPGQFVKGSKIGSDPEKSGPRNWAVPFGKKWKGKKGHDNTD